jgi:protein DJ-1
MVYDNTGSLTALTAKLPSQPLTSHPSVRSLLENGKKQSQKQLCFILLIEICSDFEYSEESVVVSNNLITRYVYTNFPLNTKFY